MAADDDISFMSDALNEARLGAASGEVPVGAVITIASEIVARAHNQPISLNDPTAHAEILAIRAAASARKYRLDGATLYVTLEPCVMCVGAIIQARVERLVFGAWDEKAGAMGSVYDIGRDGRLNHRFDVRAGVMEAQCAQLLQEFFRQRR
jgi:tRNA(adenine34) deaminase